MGGIISKKDNSLEAQHCRPLGLYPNCEWDQKMLKKLICDKRLAPIFHGKEVEEDVAGLEECPICFLHYPGGLNRTKCCKKGMCTECYLQIRLPHRVASCPFCNHPRLLVVFLGPKSQEEELSERVEKQKVIEAKLRIRRESELRTKNTTTDTSIAGKGESAPSREELKRSVESKPQPLPSEEEGPFIDPNTPIAQPSSPVGSLDFMPAVPPPSAHFGSAPSSRSRGQYHRHLHHHHHHHHQSSRRSNANPATASEPNLVLPHEMASLLANGQADELEDLMLREAIRRSLLDSQQDRNGTDGLGTRGQRRTEPAAVLGDLLIHDSSDSSLDDPLEVTVDRTAEDVLTRDSLPSSASSSGRGRGSTREPNEEHISNNEGFSSAEAVFNLQLLEELGPPPPPPAINSIRDFSASESTRSRNDSEEDEDAWNYFDALDRERERSIS